MLQGLGLSFRVVGWRHVGSMQVQELTMGMIWGLPPLSNSWIIFII